MNNYKYNRMKNVAIFYCWTIINIVLTTAYIVEFIKGNRTLYYVTQYCMFDWLPLLVTYAISLILGRGDIRIKYGVSLGYMIFYIYTMITSNYAVTFCYIFPMLCAILIYDDIVLCDATNIVTIVINIIYVAYNISHSNGDITPAMITQYEIQIACLILCAIFLHKTSTVLVYGSKKLNKLNEKIMHDELTGVYNRYFLKSFIDDNFKQEMDKEVALAIIDIDNFKGINDKYGHKFGDLVLKKLTKILLSNTINVDNTHTVRIGGDEFIIVSSLISKDEMSDLCKQICKLTEESHLLYGDTQVKFTISIGVASSNDKDCNSYGKLYDLADQMLYTVKANGKCDVATSK